MSTNDQYKNLLNDLVHFPQFQSAPRGQGTSEIIGYLSKIDMCHPIITLPDRQLDYNFMAAEAHWILSGERRLNAHVEKNLLKYSDDGKTMRGAYGPPFLQQVEYVADMLNHDKETRQAVMTIWERNPRPSKDIPCTISLQWLIRDCKLWCNAHMRSSDAWLGFPYDIFNFSMMSLYLMKKIRYELSLGTLRLFAGSQHLYQRNKEAAAIVAHSNDIGEILAIDIHRFNTPDLIMNVLDVIRNAPSDQLNYIKDNLCR